MARFGLLLALLSAVLVLYGPGETRVVGGVGLALAAAILALRLRAAVQRRAARRTLEGLRALHPHDFEAEVARWLRRDGWHVELCGGTGDGGIDLLARRRRETLAVQCKRYAGTAAVSASQVRDLYGAAVAAGATRALLVTTGRVSAPALAWAEALPAGVRVAFHDLNCLGRVATGNVRA